MKKRAGLAACIIAVLLLFPGCALFRGGQPPPSSWDETSRDALLCSTGDFVFRDEFRGILGNLITHCWDPSGNWKGDLQGDATLFASMLLFSLGNDTQDQAMITMAHQSVSYEASLVRRFFLYPVVHMDLVMGYPALAQQYLHTGEDMYRLVFLAGVRTGNIMISLMPGTFVSFVHDYATLCGTTAYLCFLAGEIAQSGSEKNAFRKKGLAWIEKAEKECWNEETGLYTYSQILDWPQTTMMMALVAAYKATGDAAYLDRCLVVLDSMEALCRDRDRGGYWGHPDLSRKGLSGNNTMAWVLLDLYEATNERTYLDRACSVLEWIVSEDLYDDRQHVIYHHWDDREGRADYFCTGCNFQTLYNIYRLNRALHPAR